MPVFALSFIFVQFQRWGILIILSDKVNFLQTVEGGVLPQ